MKKSENFDISKGRTIGIARVSTEDQSCDLQIDALYAYGCDEVIIEEGVSGSIRPQDRDGFRKARAKLRCGDTLVVWRIDRLGRNLRGFLDTMDDLSRNDIQFVSLTESFATDTALGRAMMQLIGVIAELERDMISERTIAGLRAAKKRGVKLGPKFKLSDEQVRMAHRQLRERAAGFSDLAYEFGVSRQTLRRSMERLKLIA